MSMGNSYSVLLQVPQAKNLLCKMAHKQQQQLEIRLTRKSNTTLQCTCKDAWHTNEFGVGAVEFSQFLSQVSLNQAAVAFFLLAVLELQCLCSWRLITCTLGFFARNDVSQIWAAKT